MSDETVPEMLARVAAREEAASEEDRPHYRHRVTLTDFLLARLAEDEATAGNWLRFEVRDGVPGNYAIPARVLAECEAKRRIVEECKAWSDEWAAENLGGHVLRRLATIYADHPDYRQEWATSASAPSDDG